jgi:hypothetical protein
MLAPSFDSAVYQTMAPGVERVDPLPPLHERRKSSSLLFRSKDRPRGSSGARRGPIAAWIAETLHLPSSGATAVQFTRGHIDK